VGWHTLVHVSTTESNPYSQIKTYERREFDRLTPYLEGLNADGWVEQSYCSDWLVYQVVSHISSGSRIGAARIKGWVGGGTPMSREKMQEVWGYFDSRRPEQMLGAYREAVAEYLAVESQTPDEAGLQEVDGFAGKRPLYAYQVSRVWELACHSWDVYVARDRAARLDADAVSILAGRLDQMFLPLDKERGAALAVKPVVFRLADSGGEYTLDPTTERPRLQRGAAAEAPLVIEGPDEEIVRFVSGRHFVPGARPTLQVTNGTVQDLASLRRAFR
jgi:uncharacterized protein (TIGR03083 family)